MFDSQAVLGAALFSCVIQGSWAVDNLKDRLVKIRRAHAPTSLAFANWIGITPQRWSNFENGMPLSKDVAIRLVRRIHGLTLDYVFLGRTEGLSVDLARKLGELPPSTTTKRAKG